MSTPARLSGRQAPSTQAERAVVDLAALLDQRRELGRGDGVQLGLGCRLGERRGVGAALHCGRRGDQADPAVARGRGGQARLGAHHARPPAPAARAPRAARAAPPRWRSCRRRRAAWPRARAGCRRARARTRQLVRRAVAVGKAGGVPEVEEVLVRKRHEALVQDGEPADAGVEDGDGQRAVEGSPRAPMVAGPRRRGPVGAPIPRASQVETMFFITWMKNRGLVPTNAAPRSRRARARLRTAPCAPPP